MIRYRGSVPFDMLGQQGKAVAPAPQVKPAIAQVSANIFGQAAIAPVAPRPIVVKRGPQIGAQRMSSIVQRAWNR